MCSWVVRISSSGSLNQISYSRQSPIYPSYVGLSVFLTLLLYVWLSCHFLVVDEDGILMMSLFLTLKLSLGPSSPFVVSSASWENVDNKWSKKKGFNYFQYEILKALVHSVNSLGSFNMPGRTMSVWWPIWVSVTQTNHWSLRFKEKPSPGWTNSDMCFFWLHTS